MQTDELLYAKRHFAQGLCTFSAVNKKHDGETADRWKLSDSPYRDLS